MRPQAAGPGSPGFAALHLQRQSTPSRAAIACARELHEAGARVIVFSCTSLTTIGLAPRIRAQIGCVAVDAVSAAGMFAREWQG